jgi:hypothetical protein
MEPESLESSQVAGHLGVDPQALGLALFGLGLWLNIFN